MQVDGVGMHRVQGRVQAGPGSDRGAGVAVHVHDVQVGKLRPQQVQIAQVRRRFEHPALRLQAPAGHLCRFCHCRNCSMRCR